MHDWKIDEDFDLAHHLMHTSLPQPGGMRELLALVSSAHSVHLDRAFPLWQLYLIEGLDDGRIAVYFKVHHAVIDGVGAIRLLMRCMSGDASQSVQMPAPWETEPTRSKKAAMLPTPIRSLVLRGPSAIGALLRTSVQSVAPVLREVWETFRAVQRHDPNVVLAGHAPPSLHHGRVSASRSFAVYQGATSRMRRVAEAFGVMLNDVVLAMCGGALRRYLIELGNLPDKPLVAGVPISVRRPNTMFGNEVAFTITHLATDVEDPVARLRAIHCCMKKNKAHLKDFSPGQIIAYAVATLVPGVIGSLLSRSTERYLGSVVISHVPGPREDLYWQGCRLAGLYPASVLIDLVTLNITVVSRHDFVDFGLIACRKSVPHLQRLPGHLEAELVALETGALRQAEADSSCRTAPLADQFP